MFCGKPEITRQVQSTWEHLRRQHPKNRSCPQHQQWRCWWSLCMPPQSKYTYAVALPIGSNAREWYRNHTISDDYESWMSIYRLYGSTALNFVFLFWIFCFLWPLILAAAMERHGCTATPVAWLFVRDLAWIDVADGQVFAKYKMHIMHVCVHMPISTVHTHAYIYI